ncbi:MAG: hypothetical protein ACREQI_16945 [Candidatus Binataceae bacterium]
MPPGDIAGDPFSELAAKLDELEAVIDPQARPAVARVREGLRAAIALRERGDIPAAIGAIRAAMEQLAAPGAESDGEESVAMRAIAAQFIRALDAGAKGGERNER